MLQETIIHILSILNITWYAAQVNRQHINIIMDRVDEMVQGVNNLYNLTSSLATSLNYYQLVLHIRSVLANLQDSLSYIKSVSMHIMESVNAAQLEHFHPTFYPLQTSNRCYSTLKSLYQPPCIYQYYLRIHLTFIDIYVHTFSLPIDSFYYL